jgi:hypothetical protein
MGGNPHSRKRRGRGKKKKRKSGYKQTKSGILVIRVENKKTRLYPSTSYDTFSNKR